MNMKWSWKEIIWNDRPPTTCFSRPSYCLDRSQRQCQTWNAWEIMQCLSLRRPFVWRGSNVSLLLKKKSKKMGRDVKNFVEAALDLYLNGSVDQAYEVAAMDEKSTITLIASVIWLQKKLGKIRSYRYRTWLLPGHFFLGTYRRLRKKISVNGLFTLKQVRLSNYKVFKW